MSPNACGNWNTTDQSTQLVPANPYRDKLVLQMRSGDPVSMGFGEAAVFANGIQMRSVGSVMVVTGSLSREAVYGVCNTGLSAAGGYQENLGINS